NNKLRQANGSLKGGQPPSPGIAAVTAVTSHTRLLRHSTISSFTPIQIVVLELHACHRKRRAAENEQPPPQARPSVAASTPRPPAPPAPPGFALPPAWPALPSISTPSQVLVKPTLVHGGIGRSQGTPPPIRFSACASAASGPFRSYDCAVSAETACPPARI